MPEGSPARVARRGVTTSARGSPPSGARYGWLGTQFGEEWNGSALFRVLILTVEDTYVRDGSRGAERLSMAVNGSVGPMATGVLHRSSRSVFCAVVG